MHAWTAYLACLVYAVHAIYSTIKVFIYRHGISTSNWNESRSHELAGTPEQRRDYDRASRLYRAGPGVLWKNRDAEANLDVDARNANMGTTQPVWSEHAAFSADRFFLIPRAKWAVLSLVCLMSVVLIGIGEWEMLITSGRSNWPEDVATEDPVGLTSNESIIIGCIGLATLIGTLGIAYAAIPPRTTLNSKSGVTNRRTSVSTGPTQPNTRLGNEYATEV